MKLSARGRTILAQVRKTEVVPARPEWDLPERKLRFEYVLLSDGVIGVKRTTLDMSGKVTTPGTWNVKSKVKAEFKLMCKTHPDEIRARWLRGYMEQGWTLVK